MSAARLRQAATKLREAAEVAKERPAPTANDMKLGALLGIGVIFVSPPVALALADWLCDSMRHAQSRESNGLPSHESADPRALAVADAILGDRA